jgi:hypothetical protein
MGFIRHDAIIVTAQDVTEALCKAAEIGLATSRITLSPMNGFESFLIAPDGSKEGWEDSNEGDAMRGEWIAWAKGNGDGICWAHVSYGGDEPDSARLVDHNQRPGDE